MVKKIFLYPVRASCFNLCLFSLVHPLCTTANRPAPSSWWPPHRYCKAATRSSRSLLFSTQALLPQPLLAGQALQSPQHLGSHVLSLHSFTDVIPVLWAQNQMQYSRHSLASVKQKGNPSVDLLHAPVNTTWDNVGPSSLLEHTGGSYFSLLSMKNLRSFSAELPPS